MVLVGTDARIDGTVTGPVVVVDGNVILEAHADLRDGVRVLGGDLTISPGARIRGDIFHIGINWPRMSNSLLAGLLALLLAARTATVLLALAAARQLAATTTIASARAALQRRPARVLVIGVLIVVGSTAAGALLALSLIGLLLALGVAAGLVLATTAGLAIAIDATGDTAVIRRALLLPIFGDTLLSLALITGAGALLTAGRATITPAPASSIPSLTER